MKKWYSAAQKVKKVDNWVFETSESAYVHLYLNSDLHAFFYKEPVYKEPTCRRPKYLKNLYY